MAMTGTKIGRTPDGRAIWRFHETGAANAQLVASCPGAGRRFIQAYCMYSAAPTHSGVIFSLASGLGSAFDVVWAAGAANAQRTFGTSGIPAGPLDDSDNFVVTAPAGGVGITASVAVYMEDMFPSGAAVITVPGGGSESISHGAVTSMAGSGFGSREIIHQIVDRCTGANPNVLWDNGDPTLGTAAFAYTASKNGIALPHSNIAKYAAADITSAAGGNAWLSKNVDWGAGNRFFYASAYYRMDPNHVFGPECNTGGDDNNWKFFQVSTGGAPFSGNYFYHDMGWFQKCALSDQYGDNMFSSGGLGSFDHNGVGGNGGDADPPNDLAQSWVKMEWLGFLHSSAGAIQHRLNNGVRWNQSSLNNDDKPGTSRTLAIGTFARQRDHANDVVLLADIVLLVTTGGDFGKRVMLTNNASMDSATITEFCEVTNWQDDRIDFRVNKGRLSPGTVYAHAMNGATVLGSKTFTIS